MKQETTPIPLSGRLFVDRLLAHEHPGLALPNRLGKGDLKLIAVGKNGRPPKYVAGCCPSFEGFFAAYVHDGKRWRKFALREVAAVEATYTSGSDRRSKLHGCVKPLRDLKGREAIWKNSTYMVPYPSRQPAPQPAVTHKCGNDGDCKPAAAPATANGANPVQPGKAVQLTLF